MNPDPLTVDEEPWTPWAVPEPDPDRRAGPQQHDGPQRHEPHVQPEQHGEAERAADRQQPGAAHARPSSASIPTVRPGRVGTSRTASSTPGMKLIRS